MNEETAFLKEAFRHASSISCSGPDCPICKLFPKMVVFTVLDLKTMKPIELRLTEEKYQQLLAGPPIKEITN